MLLQKNAVCPDHLFSPMQPKMPYIPINMEVQYNRNKAVVSALCFQKIFNTRHCLSVKHKFNACRPDRRPVCPDLVAVNDMKKEIVIAEVKMNPSRINPGALKRNYSTRSTTFFSSIATSTYKRNVRPERSPPRIKFIGRN